MLNCKRLLLDRDSYSWICVDLQVHADSYISDVNSHGWHKHINGISEWRAVHSAKNGHIIKHWVVLGVELSAHWLRYSAKCGIRFRVTGYSVYCSWVPISTIQHPTSMASSTVEQTSWWYLLTGNCKVWTNTLGISLLKPRSSSNSAPSRVEKVGTVYISILQRACCLHHGIIRQVQYTANY